MSYHCVMKDTQENGSSTQGVETQQVTKDQMREKLISDLGRALSCLDAIYQDPAALNALVDVMYGRWMNYQAHLARKAEEESKVQA